MGRLWALLGPSWEPLGPSWGSLGGFLGALGAILMALGPSDGRKGANPQILQTPKEDQVYQSCYLVRPPPPPLAVRSVVPVGQQPRPATVTFLRPPVCAGATVPRREITPPFGGEGRAPEYRDGPAHLSARGPGPRCPPERQRGRRADASRGAQVSGPAAAPQRCPPAACDEKSLHLSHLRARLASLS